MLLALIGNYLSAQTSSGPDFLRVEGKVRIDPRQGKVQADLTYFFELLQPVDSLFLDAQGMEFSKVALNGIEVPHTNTGKRIGVPIGGLSHKGLYDLHLRYEVAPRQTMYFVGWENTSSDSLLYAPQVWTQGQGKYTSHWLPSFDDTSEKLEFDLTYIFPKGYEVIANGALRDRRPLNDSTVAWTYDMDHHMSSYLVAMVAGKYQVKELLSKEGTPISLYFYPEDEERVEPTYRYTLDIFNYLEEEIGVAYPWNTYKQVPVRDFLHSGMENTTTTIFSDFLMTDSLAFEDRNYVMVNAHELAHQWFGNLVTAAGDEDHWLQEGFATYYALLAEREIFGQEHYYWQLYSWAEELELRSQKGEGQAVNQAGGSSLTYYYQGAWVLHRLREILGDEAFREGVRQYLIKYQYSSARTQDFLDQMEAVSGMDLTDFAKRWLLQSAFPAEEALSSLQKSPFLNQYLQIAALKGLPLDQKRDQLEQALRFPVNDYIGQQVIHQLALESPREVLDLYHKGFESHNSMVRQAIALSLGQVPLELKTAYESLLQDDSYLTREAALYHLWASFPEDRAIYLRTLEGVEGFYDKNLEILWLGLHLATPEFKPETRQQSMHRLIGYTNSAHPFYIRRNAFNFLYQLDAFEPQSLASLAQGTQHPVWRFRSFCRQLMEELLEKPHYQSLLQDLSLHLPEKEREYTQSLLRAKRVDPD